MDLGQAVFSRMNADAHWMGIGEALSWIAFRDVIHPYDWDHVFYIGASVWHRFPPSELAALLEAVSQTRF